MDQYDSDQDGRLSLDEYLGDLDELSWIYLHYLLLRSILIDFAMHAPRALTFQN